MHRLLKALVLISAVLVSSLIFPTVASASCVTEWSTCRSDATRAYFNDEVGTFRYSLLLDGCDIGYGFCQV
jgi:hypothetical protein